MFLAGLEIDLQDSKKNSKKSSVVLTWNVTFFVFPMISWDFWTGLYFGSKWPLDFGPITFASMFASHTPDRIFHLISKLGRSQKIELFNITVGHPDHRYFGAFGFGDYHRIYKRWSGILALWCQVDFLIGRFFFCASWLLIRAVIIIYFSTSLAVGFFKKILLQFLPNSFCVLVTGFLGAGPMAELAGVEAIIGAF